MGDMSRHGVARSLSFYEIAMKKLAAQQQYRAALAMYDRLAADGLQPSHVTYSCLISFAAEVGDPRRAMDFFNKLSELTTPSIRAYMTMLRVLAMRQDWPASLALFRQMRGHDVRPDTLILNTVLATGVLADQVEAAAALLEEVDSEATPLSDIISYNTLVKGFAQRGNVDAAINTLERMRRRGMSPNSITYNTTMDAAVRGGKSDEAWKILALMCSAGLRPDKFTRTILMKGLAEGVPLEHIQSALEVLAEVGGVCDTALLSSLYHNVLKAAAAGSHRELMENAFLQMRRVGVQPSASAQRHLVQVFSREETNIVSGKSL